MASERDTDQTETVAPGQILGPGVEAADPDDLAPGTHIGPYVLQSVIASGGGGTVYVAEHALLGRRAAVKVLRREMATSTQALSRFLREARVVNMIRHAAIVDIYEFGRLPDGRPYYVMELLEGSDLRTVLHQRGRLDPAETLDILTPVCSALEAAHAVGVVHRDLKASNICVSPTPAGPVVKLLDFGIAKLLQPDPDAAGLTAVGTRLGTPNAMAPEQIRCEEVDARTDIYALGVLVYQLLTGVYPFSAGTRQELERMHLEGTPPRPSRKVPVPPALDAFVLRCLEKDRDRRYQTVGELLLALREAVGGAPPPSEAAPEREMKAVAVHVELRSDADGQSGGIDESDELLESSAEVLDLVEATLRGAGFALPLLTSSAVLGTCLLPDTPDEERRERKRALEVARSLARTLADRPGARPDLHISVALHADTAVVRTGGSDPEITGGAIVLTAAWRKDARPADGVLATRQALAGIEPGSP